MEEEEQERKRKVEAGKAKLAQFRQRKGQTDGQTTAKKSKKKKGSSGSKHSDRRDDAPETSLSQSDETQCQSAKSGASTTAEFTITRTVPHGEIIKHNQTFTIEPESEISTTAEDYSSEVTGDSFSLTGNHASDLEREEEFGVRETYSEHGTQSSPTRLEVMEDELAGKQQEIEELNRELEEMRAAYGTEGLQQLQEFEMAIKQRDGIITQLTTNLQQARKEKDNIMREFLELTEQSQNLKIQFQHLQASETIRNTSRTSTAADLFQSRQQIFTYQQQLEEQEQRLKHYQKENEELHLQLVALQEETRNIQQVRQSELEASYAKKLTEKDLTVNGLKSALIDEEQKSCQLKETITAADRTVHELREELTLKSQEINSLTEELNISKQKERRSSEEIKQLMGTVEDLQKKHHKDAQSEADIVHRLELETQRKLEQLQAELDEMYGQQIVQMKQELVKQHTLEIEKLGAEHKATVENLSNQTEINAQIQTLTSTVSGLNSQLQHADEQRTKMKEDLDHRLEAVSSEKSLLQRQIEDLLQDLSFAREQIHRARQTISEKESRLNEANSLQATIESLRSELASANEFTKELETKHEAEVTNYKIKLDMLEREKDAVLGRMAESQEAELEKLRTYFLFSQEEELSKLREDLAREHRINVENLKANLDMQYNERMDRLQREMGQIICDLQSENEGLLTNQDSLVVEMSKLSELLQSVNDPKSAATMTQVNEVRVDLDSLNKGQEKGSVKEEVQALQLKIELLQAELKDKHIFRERIAALELDNTLLKEQNNTLQKASKNTIIDHGETSLSDGANADSLVFKREIEILSAENKRLCNLELQSREEIEWQKNTFSFAEKNFEVNYHELQEEYTCLLNIKVQLEEDQAKLDEEYQLKLCALNDELSKLKLDSKQSNDSALEGSLTLVEADALGGVEVVEKDTTELMEKLEIAQRDKQELSQRVFDLSEQVHLKQREINQLKEQVKSLHGERDDSLGDGQEAEESRKSVHPNNCTSSYSLVDFGELQPETQNILEEKEPSPKASTQSISTLRDELFLLRNVQCERDGLQNQLAIMQQEQADMRLQMEAQRISLSQIHLAHMNLVSENFQREKAQEIHSLKEEMQRVQEQKLEELQDGHQQELKELWVEHPETRTSGDVTDGEAVGSSNTLIEMLRKRIHNEYNHINQYIHIEKPTNVVNETKYVEMSVLQESSRTSVVQKNLREAQTVHTHLMTLLDTLLEEYKRVTELYSSVEQTCGLHMNEEKQQSDVSSIIQTSCKSSPPPHHTEDLKTQKITTSLSEGAEKFKNEFNVQRTQLEEKHTQEIEHLRSYFQQQLKETEERYTMEIIHLQEQLHSVSQTSLEFRVPSGSQSVLQLGVQEADLFNSVFGAVSKELKMADEAHCGPIYHQLNILRQSLYSRYVEEVNALKKQHEAELDHLKVDLTGKYTLENAALKEEVVQLKQAAKENLQGNIAEFSLHHNGNLEEDNNSDINQLLEERYRERIVEEIARVIVEMTVGFAQQTELARLATLTEGKDETSREGPAERGDKLLHNEDADDEQRLCDEKSENLQSEVVKSQGETPSTGSQNVPTSDVKNVDFDVFLSSDQSLFTGQTSGQSPTHQDRETLLKEKTVVLNEKDYNQMVAMGAESAKLYEERVEDMRQELVRLEQEHQQATEALRLAHAAQLERQMCDQEQLLTELQTVRAQLAENVMVYSENQATERERILIEELESLKLARLENREEKQGFMRHESSSQTEDESVRASECDEELQEGATGSAEGNEETQVVPPSDLSCDRNTLKRANKRLSKILLEIVKTTGAVEETIGRHVVGLLDKSGRRLSNTKVLAWCPDAACDTEAPLAGSAIVSDLEKKVPSWSGDEGSKLPQLLTEEELDVNPEDEGHVLNIVTRLQAAVEKLLEAINNTSNQLEHAKAAQTELVRESIKRKQETTGLLRIQEELQERLNEEAKAREHLAVELGKAEGLLDGYTDDRVFLEKQMQEKNDLIQHLEQELHSTGNRLQEFEQERQQIQEERELLSRQKNALKADTGTAEQRLVDAAVDAAPKEELLEETEKLFKEKIEVQRQAEKDSGDFHKQVKVLETELEDQVNRYLELEQEKNAELEDLRQKNLALEKQLDKTRKFLDEQAVDREHERDVFQQEIQKLEQQLKMPQRHQPTNGQQSNQVETLENNLKEKTDKCNELLLSKEQLQRDVQERNEEIEKLECRIRELEQAVLISADNLQKVEERRSSIIKGVKGEMPLEALLQVEREAMDRKEKEITNLEEQLEQFREELENKNEEVQQLHMQLEIQKKESATKIHGLEQESKLLKDEFEDLQHKLQGDSTFKTSKPGKHEELLLLKDQEIDQLSEQISRLQAQVEAAPDNKVIEEKNEQIKEYKSQIKCLKSDQERLRKNSEEEIEKLNEVIEKLQEELARIEQKGPIDRPRMTEVGYNNKHKLEDIAEEEETLQKNFAVGETEINPAKIAHLEIKAGDLENLKDSKGSNGKRTMSESNHSNSLESEMEASEQSLANPMFPSLLDMETQLHELQQVIKEKDSELLQYSSQVKEMKEQVQVVEHLNSVIQKLQMELAERDQNISLELTSLAEDAESSKHHLETVTGEKSTIPEDGLIRATMTVSLADFEATEFELKSLKEELKTLKERPGSSMIGITAGSTNRGTMTEGNAADIKKLEEELREKTANHLAKEILLQSIQETAQSTVHSLETQIQELQKAIKEKDSELSRRANQAAMLEEQVHQIERLNGTIRTLQNNMTSLEERMSIDFNKRVEALQEEKELFRQKAETNDEAVDEAIAEMEDAKMEVKMLEDKIQNLLAALESKAEQERTNILSNDGKVTEDLKATLEKMEDALRDKTAQLLASQALYTSMQESMQSVINSLESQLQELKIIIQVKDSEMLQLEDQMELLSKRTEEINQLNGVIATLQKELSHAMQKSTPQTLLKSKDSERINQNLTTAMPQEGALHQDARLNNDEMNLTLLELEETKSKVKVLKEELEKLRMAREIAQNASDDTAFGLVKAKVESRPADGKDGQEILGEKHESLLTNQAWQTTINAMEAELQELQKVLAEKDLELLQYSNEIELLKEQVKAEGDQHDQMMVAMEDTLREKVAAALVSEAQIKAIQVHTTKLMQRSDVISVLEENSKGTQASASTEGKEAESKLSELSLRLLQLEKQLADLHEELQVERDNVNAANQQAAEKACKLRELQSVLESTMARPRDVQIAIQPGDEERITSQSNAMADLGQELEIVKAEAAATKEELCHYRELAEKLKEEMTVKETRVAHLQEELCNTKKVLSEVDERLSQYLKREEELAEQNKQSLDGIGGPGQPAFERTTSSSQTDNASSVHNGNQTTRVHHVDKEVQKDMDTRQKRVASDEVQELVEQYSEKFGQMQDLHAAEILDMEARHIAEADSLRRETYVAVQSLTEECESLKAVIEALKSERTIPGARLSESYKFPDAVVSDTDWSQGFYGQGFDSTAEEMGNDDGVDVEALSGFLPSKIKTLLRAVHQEGIQVLSLSESAIAGQNMQLPGTSPQSWMEERKSLVETIGCLKNLIGKMQNEDRSELGDGLDFPDGTLDWRGDLLQAIQDVFCKEQEVLMAAYHTQLDTLGTCDAATLVKQMQHRLEEMGVEQINAMDCIQNADRRSLLLEIQDLRSQLSGLRSVGTAGHPFHLHFPGDVIDNTVQQDQPAQTLETHTQLNVPKTKGTEVHSEQFPAAEMNDELAQTKQKLESALKPVHTHFKELESLRMELQQRSDELDVVHKALMNEQKKNRDLQWALEEERAKTEKSDVMEDLDIIIEDQRLKNEELSILLETEKQIVKGLQDRISSMEMAHESELSQERSNSSELQTVLQVEKARSAELANAFHIKREMESQTESHAGAGQMPEINPAEDLLQELHGQLESKHQHVVALSSEVESTRLECEQLRQSLEEARASHLKELLAQQDSANTAHQQAEALKSQVEDLQRKLKKSMLDLQKLEVDRTRLKETVQNLQNNVHEEPDGSRAERKGLVDTAAVPKALTDRSETQALHHKGGGGDAQGPGSVSLNTNNGETSANVESIRRRLEQVSTKLKQLATKAAQRIVFEEADDEDFAWSGKSLQDVLSQLEQVAVSSLQERNFAVPPGSSTNSLTERLLTQNAELTGHVSRLTEEKNDLRNALLRMEDETSRYMLTGSSGDHSPRSPQDSAVNIDRLMAIEREQWKREKLQYQKSLKECEAELHKVKAELKSVSAHRDTGRECENSVIKRVYGKYLRSESFRKALVYQKKYLLLLLGGFQECEEATLSLIARMGGLPSYTDLTIITNRSRAFTRFRSAVRVSIAISRMKFLVCRWQKAAGSSTNRNGFGQNTGNEVRTDSTYLASGHLDHYGGHRHSSCRSRSGFDSPMSTVNSHHRYSGGLSDLSPCSHIQNYDPDRALTDYITRLEALQKRLGGAQTASTVSNTTRYGIRR